MKRRKGKARNSLPSDLEPLAARVRRWLARPALATFLESLRGKGRFMHMELLRLRADLWDSDEDYNFENLKEQGICFEPGMPFKQYACRIALPGEPTMSPKQGGQPSDLHLFRSNEYIRHRHDHGHDEACRRAGCEEMDLEAAGRPRRCTDDYLAILDAASKYGRPLTEVTGSHSLLEAARRALVMAHGRLNPKVEAFAGDVSRATGMTPKQAARFIDAVEAGAGRVQKSLTVARTGIHCPPTRLDGNAVLSNEAAGWMLEDFRHDPSPPEPGPDGFISKKDIESWIRSVWASRARRHRPVPTQPDLSWMLTSNRPLPEPCTCPNAREPRHGHCVVCGTPIPARGPLRHPAAPGVARYACHKHAEEILQAIGRHGSSSFDGLTGGADGYPKA